MTVASEHEGGSNTHQIEVFNPQGADGLNSGVTWEHHAHARQLYIAGAAAAVDALSASAEVHRGRGDMTRLAETETWLALAREDLDSRERWHRRRPARRDGARIGHDRAVPGLRRIRRWRPASEHLAPQAT